MVGKILIGVGVLILVLISIAFFSVKSAQKEPPPQLIANFVDLNKIEKISKYRSCSGHTTVPQDKREMKRSMKHYFWVKKEFLGDDTVEVYSPYDGYVSDMRTEPGKGLEGEIWIFPKQMFAMIPPFGAWNFSVQHINILKGLKLGDKVKAGDLIGYAAAANSGGDSFDIVYAKSGFPPKKIDNWTAPFSALDSVFNHMSDEVFAKYQEKGLSKEALIMSKEQRDQGPCKYRGEGPDFENRDDSTNWAILQ